MTTLEKVKSTIVSTELDQDKSSKRKSKDSKAIAGDDGLIEDRDSDSDFSESKANLEGKKESARVWDDEENYVGDDEEREDAMDEEGEEESILNEETEEKMAVEDIMAESKMSDAESDVVGRKRRQVKKGSAASSQASHIQNK